MLLAMAVPAFADTSGTVYGKAVLAPYAITITGGGTDPGNPLTYEGMLGDYAWEKFDTAFTVQNSGTQSTDLKLDVDQLPQAGGDTWNLSTDSGANTGFWRFFAWTSGRHSTVLPVSDPAYSWDSTLERGLGAGSSEDFSSGFGFPTQTNSTADHYMSATISAVAPIN
jgi:hypothetical protein